MGAILTMWCSHSEHDKVRMTFLFTCVVLGFIVGLELSLIEKINIFSRVKQYVFHNRHGNYIHFNIRNYVSNCSWVHILTLVISIKIYKHLVG